MYVSTGFTDSMPKDVIEFLNADILSLECRGSQRDVVYLGWPVFRTLKHESNPLNLPENIGDCVGSQGKLTGTPLDPPLFWLDISGPGHIFNVLRFDENGIAIFVFVSFTIEIAMFFTYLQCRDVAVWSLSQFRPIDWHVTGFILIWSSWRPSLEMRGYVTN
jgi:hypothetical protein